MASIDPRISNGFSRRRFLALAGAVGGGAVLGACSSGTEGQSVDEQSLELPTQGKAPEVPEAHISGDSWVPPAYTEYPAPYETVSEVPGSGGTITALLINYLSPPPSENRWQDELNKKLGVTWKPTLMAPADITQKTSAIIAGGDMPDIFYLNTLPGQAPAAAQAVLQGAFTDLTDHLAGDAIEEYPNLALIPGYSWENSAIEGHFYGVPRQTPLLSSGTPGFRTDWAREMGIEQPADSDEMFELLTGFSTMKHPAGEDIWAFSSLQIYWQNIVILQMFDVPNNWSVSDDGTFTKDIETDEFEEATAYMAELWKAGAYHPNAPGSSWEDQTGLWSNGQIGVWGTGLTGVYSQPKPALVGVDPNAYWNHIGVLVTPGRDGGSAGQYQGTPGGGGVGNFGVFAVPSSAGEDEAKVKEILRILNYAAAPFGSTEYTFLTYGIEGWNHTVEQGVPQLSTETSRLSELAANYLCQPRDNTLYIPAVLPNGEVRNFALDAQKLAEELTPDSVPDPSATLVSDAQVGRGPNLQQQLNDDFVGIVTGRTGGSITDALADMRRSWAEQGGDEIRGEYEEAWAKAKK